jgi:hypothetical protein
MIPSNGSCSGGRAIPERRTPVGKIAPSVGRERDCCGVFVSRVPKSMTKPLPSSMRSPNFTLSGSRPDELCKTSTFTRRLRISPK